ncbi:MAG TPA: hypothetical protein VK846_13675, partial [Candidatus Limnocylindria bacterium]|nr:hypothetical protein [Candidatus Limnocylindria bacterium]
MAQPIASEVSSVEPMMQTAAVVPPPLPPIIPEVQVAEAAVPQPLVSEPVAQVAVAENTPHEKSPVFEPALIPPMAHITPPAPLETFEMKLG